MVDAALSDARAWPPPRVLSERAWIGVPLGVLGALFFYPLALIVRQALTGGGDLFSFEHIAAVLRTNLFQSAVWHTIEIAVAASAGCLLLGFAIALVLSFVPFPGAREVARFIDTFIALPTFLMAVAFTFIYGSAGVFNGVLIDALGYELPPVDFLYSIWGVILAEVTVYTPFVLRPLIAAFSQIETAQIEVAASLGAKPWRIIREVILPAGLPALLAGGSLCLLLTVNEFGIVLFIGAKGVITLPLLVYDKAIQQGDYTAACVIALINIVLSLSLYTLYRRLVARLGGEHAGVV
jgi:2-aminoethylphosphonate transport system permease protein